MICTFMRDFLWLYSDFNRTKNKISEWLSTKCISILQICAISRYALFTYLTREGERFEAIYISINECLLMHAYKHKEKCIYFIPPPCPLIMNMHVYYIF